MLRQAVPHWLAEPEFATLVVSFSQAPRRLGGEGALYVYGGQAGDLTALTSASHGEKIAYRINFDRSAFLARSPIWPRT